MVFALSCSFSAAGAGLDENPTGNRSNRAGCNPQTIRYAVTNDSANGAGCFWIGRFDGRKLQTTGISAAVCSLVVVVALAVAVEVQAIPALRRARTPLP
jgi:hypothetical protein